MFFNNSGDESQLIINGKIVGEASNHDFKLLIFDPGAASDQLILTLQTLSSHSFIHKGYQIRKFNENIDTVNIKYSHLILFHESAAKIAGWCRFAKTTSIITQYGLASLYSSRLFEFRSDFIEDKLKYSYELGRNFVRREYMGTLAEAYLWGGILRWILSDENNKYIHGLTSISGHYPIDIMTSIVYFYNLYYGEKESYVQPKHNFNLSKKSLNTIESLLSGNDFHADYSILNKHLKEYNYTVPTMIKHSTSLCEPVGTKILSVGINQSFGNCVDLFCMLDVDKIKPLKLKGYLKLINMFETQRFPSP